MSKDRLTKYEINFKLNKYRSLTLYHKQELEKYQDKIDILNGILINEESLDKLTKKFNKLEEDN